MGEELTRFPITPDERHQTARSFDDVKAVPEENLPRPEERPQDKPLPPSAHDEAEAEDDDGDDDEDDDEDEPAGAHGDDG